MLTIPADIRKQIEEIFQSQIQYVSSVGGGCIADSKSIHFHSGTQIFIKFDPSGLNFSAKEAHGLKELELAQVIRIPNVLAQTEAFLAMEWIESEPVKNRKTFFTEFGEAFANLHKKKGASYGFFEDNLIGSNLQKNISTSEEAENWYLFYKQKRLDFQMELAQTNGLLNRELDQAYQSFLPALKDCLNDNTESPCLIHGDLWGGNFLCDSNQKPVLIDPAVYYGHREADLAMTRLFGGFDASFYDAYRSAYPLKAGYEHREGIYLLYHILNHMNLFGISYRSQALQIMREY